MDQNGWIAKVIGFGLAGLAGYLAKKGIEVSGDTLTQIGAGVVAIVGVVVSIFAHKKALDQAPPK